MVKVMCKRQRLAEMHWQEQEPHDIRESKLEKMILSEIA